MANGVEQEGLNIEQAMASGINPELAIVGTEEYNTSTRQAPGVPTAGSPIMSPQFGAQAPSYGWGVGAQDLGQGAVQQIRTDQFVTPVAMQQYPAGAIAARNQSLAQQRMAVEKAKQDALKAFDWTKGLESPAAQHEYAWWQYLTNTWWPQTVSKFAEAYGVTPEEAISMMATTPEGQRYLQLETMKANSAARFSRGMTDRYMDILGKIQEGKVEVDEDERKAILEYVNAVDPTTGVPYEFNDMEDLVKRAVNFEATMSMAAFKDKFLKDFDKFAEEVFAAPDTAYGKGGNVVLTKEVEQRFGEFKSGMLQAAKELGMNEDKVRDFMDKIIKDRIKKEATLHPNRYATSRGSGSGSSKGPMPVKAQMRPIPSALREEVGIAIDPLGAPAPALGDDFPTVPLMSITAGQGAVPRPQYFTKGGEPVLMFANQVMDVDGRKFIMGEVAQARGAQRIGAEVETETPEMRSILDQIAMLDREKANATTDEEIDAIDAQLAQLEADYQEASQQSGSEYQDFVRLRPVMVPYEENRETLARHFNIDLNSLEDELGRLANKPRPPYKRPTGDGKSQGQQKADVRTTAMPKALEGKFDPDKWSLLSEETQKKLIAKYGSQ